MLIYLAQPIDQTKGAQHAVGGVTHTLRACGIHFYRPAGAFGINGASTPDDLGIVNFVNTNALLRADALVAWLPPGVPTLGTPSEIEQALAMNKPVLILSNMALLYSSVQMLQWADRGATVRHWDDALARWWEANPEDLLQILEQRPGIPVHLPSRGIYDEAAANHNANAGVLADELARVSENLTIRLDALHRRINDLAGQVRQFAPEVETELEAFTPELQVLSPSPFGTPVSQPTRAHHDDAGFDLAITNTETLEAGECRMLPTGVWGALPTGHWGLIIGRSSTWVKYTVDVRLGVIDPGYRGELMIQAHNKGEKPITFPAGTRLAQYVLLPSFPGRVVAVDTLPPAERGENGYGSSGA